MWAGTCRAYLDNGEKLGLIRSSGVDVEGAVTSPLFGGSLNGREAALLFGERSELMFPGEVGVQEGGGRVVVL